MKLLTQYPLWLVIFALLLGVGYALYLYYKNNNVIFEKPMRIAMASLRGLAVALIAFLLLAPMVKLTVKQTDKPIVLVAIDNSESVKSNKDSAFYAKEYPGQVAKLISELGDSYVVKTYLVGDEGSIASRSRDIKIRKLNVMKMKEDRLGYQLLNILLPTGIIIIAGIVIVILRRRKYRKHIAQQ